MRSFVVMLLVLAFLNVACEPKPKAGLAPELVEAGEGPVQALVAEALAQAGRDRRRLVVYVGATWCEPCKHFAAAIEANTLPSGMGDLRFLKFDSDRDAGRLERDGFGGSMLPRFVVPTTQGRGSDKRFEGAVKGIGAMDNILPKLELLLAP